MKSLLRNGRPRRLSDRLAARALVLAIDPNWSARSSVESLLRLSEGRLEQLHRAERLLVASGQRSRPESTRVSPDPSERERTLVRDRAVQLLRAARLRAPNHQAFGI